MYVAPDLAVYLTHTQPTPEGTMQLRIGQWLDFEVCRYHLFVRVGKAERFYEFNNR